MISPSRIFGAIEVYGGGDKALDSIPTNLIKQDDFAIVQDGINVYFYILDSDSGLDENVPYVIKPDDIESAVDPSSVNKRWHLISTKYFTDNIIQSHGNYIETSQLKAIDGESLEFLSGDGAKITIAPNGTITVTNLVATEQIKVQNEGWKAPFVVDSTLLVENLNADRLDGYHASSFALIDGSNPFTGPVTAHDPVDDNHLTTKSWIEEYILQVSNIIYTYVDDAIAAIDITADITALQNQINAHISASSDDHTQYVHIDGRRNFIAPIGGVTPTLPIHLSTKGYVDDAISSITTIHGSLLELGEDDHLQYAHIDARRGFENPILGKTPVSDFHLTTKEYVDERIANIFHTKKLQIHTFDHDATEWVINHNFGNKDIVVDFYDKWDNKQIKPDTFTLTNADTAIATFADGTDGYAVVTGITEHYNHSLSNTWIIEHTFSSKESVYNTFNEYGVEIHPDTTTIVDNTHIAFTFVEPQEGFVVMSDDITVFDFSTPSTEWHVHHVYNNKNLLANCFTDANVELVPKDIEATDDNTLLVTFHTPQSGYVIVSGSEAVILDPGLFIINHDNLRNLDEDDHIQYILVDGSRGFTDNVNGIYPTLFSHLTTKQYVDDEITNALNVNIVSSHDELLGLEQDDHPQYILEDGSRSFSGPVEGINPTMSFHLATKQYVDLMVTSSGSQPQYGVVDLVSGADNITVHLTTAISGYSVDVTIENLVDINPSIYGYIVIRKTSTEFDVIFSGYIDSANYKLNWVVHPT